MSANLLDRETSPYLLQHKDNPVHWMTWGAEAFARARAENRPVLLSVGYAACHWCHVMAHESFENEEIAAEMNRLFVNVKVDREERPDIDQIYQAALSAMGQHGGWPLTMFITPDGDPFWGGTYFPPTAKYGRPGFGEVLRGVSSAYHDEREKIGANIEALREALTRLSDNRGGQEIDPVMVERIAERLSREVDTVHGGIGSAPKFPQVPIFELFWRHWLRSGREPQHTAVLNTLTHMCQGGIYDHLGGGFARYSVDELWLVPHFEKMLYDNAQLVHLLTLVWRETEQPLFAVRVRETVGWVIREMTAEGGAFATSLDADSEGEEGRFYLWKEAEVDALLGEGSTEFKRVYGVTRVGNWEGPDNILHRLNDLPLGIDEAEAKLAEQRAVLMKARDGRIRPGWDDKVLADWNGLMIAALADAAMAFDEPEWLAAAERAFHFVATEMVREGRLHHVWRAGTLKHLGSIDDIAAMIKAALALFDATGNAAYRDRAKEWVGSANAHHWDGERGGYFFNAADAAEADGTPLICRTKTVSDASTPSGNGMMVANLARLHAVTGDPRYRDRAEGVITAFSGELARNFFPLPTFLNAVETLNRPVSIVLIGDHGTAEMKLLEREAYRHSLPDRILLRIALNDALPKDHPANGKTAIDGKPTAYVCIGQTCSAPVTTASALADALSRD